MNELYIIRSGDEKLPMKPATRRTVSLHITMNCNYHCSYCCSKHSLDSGQWSKELFFKNIDWIIIDNKATDILFFGGEPLLHPDFLDAVSKCKTETKCTLKTVTNCSMELNFLKKLYSIDPEFETTVSIHFEKLRIDPFLEKATFLASQRKGTHFKIMLHPSFRDKAHSIYESLKLIIKDTESYISCGMIRFPQQGYVNFSPDYTDEDWEFYHQISQNASQRGTFFIEFCDDSGRIYVVRDKYESLLKSGLLQFPSLLCSINAERCIFDITGGARKHVCHTKNVLYKPYGSSLFDDEPIRCKLPRCHCEDRTHVPKNLYGFDDKITNDRAHMHSIKLEVEDILVQNKNNTTHFLLRNSDNI